MADEQNVQPEGQIGARAVRGMVWSYGGLAINGVLQLGYTAVMARMLSADAFGLFAMANFFLRFGSYVSQLGVVSAIVQKGDLREEELRGATSVSILLGMLVSVFFFCTSPLIASFFSDTRLTAFIRVLSVTFLVSSLSVTGMAMMRRKMDFRRIVLFETISFFIGYVIVGVGCASMGWGVWSLIMATLGQGIVLALLVLFSGVGRLSLGFSFGSVKRLYSFGGRISVITILEAIGSTLDTFTIGKFLGSVSLGLYNRAFMLVNVPMQQLTTGFSRVLFPSLCRMQDDRFRFAHAVLLTERLVSSILVPLCCIGAAAGETIVTIILGKAWISAAPLFRILCLATIADLLCHVLAVGFEASAALNKKVFIQSTFIVILLICFAVGIRYGVEGMAYALCGALWLRFAFYVVLARVSLGVSLTGYVGSILPAVATGIICAAVILATDVLPTIHGLTWLLSHACYITAALGVWLLSFYLGPQKTAALEIRSRILTLRAKR